MPDTIASIQLLKLKLKISYDASLLTLQEEEYKDVSRKEEDIRIARYNFETASLANLTKLNAQLDATDDLNKKEAIQNLIDKTTKQNEITLKSLEQIWAKELSDIKQSYVAKRNALKTQYDQNLYYLEVRESAIRESEAKAKKEIPQQLLITRVPYPKWWKELRSASIVLSGAGYATIIPANSNYKIYIATIVLVVDGETTIHLGFGVFGSSGGMLLGGDTHPSGMVIAMGSSPAPCGNGSFGISGDTADVNVGGFCTYYLEADVEQPI